MLFVYQTPSDKIFLGRVGADSNSCLISPGFSQLSVLKKGALVVQGYVRDELLPNCVGVMS